MSGIRCHFDARAPNSLKPFSMRRPRISLLPTSSSTSRDTKQSGLRHPVGQDGAAHPDSIADRPTILGIALGQNEIIRCCGCCLNDCLMGLTQSFPEFQIVTQAKPRARFLKAWKHIILQIPMQPKSFVVVGPDPIGGIDLSVRQCRRNLATGKGREIVCPLRRLITSPPGPGIRVLSCFMSSSEQIRWRNQPPI